MYRVRCSKKIGRIVEHQYRAWFTDPTGRSVFHMIVAGLYKNRTPAVLSLRVRAREACPALPADEPHLNEDTVH